MTAGLSEVIHGVLVLRVASWSTAETRIMASFSHRFASYLWDI